MPLETDAGTKQIPSENLDAVLEAVFIRLTDGSMNSEDLDVLRRMFIEKGSVTYGDIIGVSMARALANSAEKPNTTI